MKYLCLVYVEEKTSMRCRSTSGSPSDESMAYCDDLQKHGQLLAASPLHPVDTATTVRVRDGKTTTTDGPFAETKEQLGGYLSDRCAGPERRRPHRLEVSRRPVWKHRGAADQRRRLCT